MFSKACEYGIKATLHVAGKSLNGVCTNLKEIAEVIQSPEAYTAKILQLLVRAKIIDSIKGAKGGFVLPINRMQSIRLWDIVFAIDGDGLLYNCVLGLRTCSEINPCPLHPQYKIVKSNLMNMLEGTFIIDLLKGLSAKETVLRN